MINGRWVIGNDGNEHRLIEDGVVVYDEDRIIHVGKSYTGHVDEKIDAGDKIVSPGFVNTHCHAHTALGTVAFAIDFDLKNTFGNPNLAYDLTRDKIGKFKMTGISRSEEDVDSIAKFTLYSLLKSGCTTIMELGGGREGLVRLFGDIGLRAYLAPHFRNAEIYTGDDGTIFNKDWSDDRGFKGLERGIEFVEKYNGAYDGRINAFLNPDKADACTPELLKEARKAATDLGVGISIHVGQRVFEFQDIIRKHRKTPIGYLESTGLLGPDVVLGHAMMVSGHSWTAYPGDEDVEIMARTGVSVAHCPLTFARMGCGMQSFGRYLRHGVNMSIGTDTWPLDIISNMRWASIISKIMEGDRASATSLEVFNAATLGGAKALRRNDIGRLAKGAKADIVIIDVKNFRYAPVGDPVKSLVNAGTCDDVDTVIVNGEKLVEGGKIIGVDEEAVLRETDRIAREEWENPERSRAARARFDVVHRSKSEMKPWDPSLE